jgi:(2Fe-2S) ferredoxin
MTDQFYSTHIFCCTNRREDGHKRGCCASRGSEALRTYAKKRVKELGINTQDARVRVNTAGCLDRCELGPVMVIYPEGLWYRYETEADVDAILDAHFVQKTQLPRLLLRVDQKDLNG